MKRLKSEKGIIAIVTLITVLLMVSFLISSYIISSNKVKTQKEILAETRKIYEPKHTMEEIYNSYFNNDNVIPIYSVEELLAIKEIQSNIKGKYYNHKDNTVYVLMNDLEFSATDLNLQSNWTPIENNPNFIGNFSWNDNTIKVTTLNGNIELYDGKTLVTTIAYKNLEEEVSSDVKIAVDNGKISTVLKETINGVETTAVVPKGYELSTTKGEHSISEGLVITDGANEFVWIPVTRDFTSTYVGATDYSEPTLTDYDTQEQLNKYYGTKEDGTNYYTLETDFDLTTHYAEMVESVNKYDGFYIGRYETTIDGNNVGSKEGSKVLTFDQSISQTNNKPCRWWGLYAVQRNANVVGNGTTVQTNMIWGQQWDAMITYFGDKDYSETKVKTLATSQAAQNAGQTKYTYNSEEISDEICNIYDLRGNTYDRTAEAYNTFGRVSRARWVHQQVASVWSW